MPHVWLILAPVHLQIFGAQSSWLLETDKEPQQEAEWNWPAVAEHLRDASRLEVVPEKARGEVRQRGVRRHIVDPVVHFALRCSGVDSAEDLDGERLQRRWAAGKAQLEALLVDVHQETNVGDSGFLLYGAKAST